MSDMTPKQITQALEAGIITPAQAAKMRGETAPASEAMIGQEDEMRFLRSFSDVFIAIGLVILALGASGFFSVMGGGPIYLVAAAGAGLMAEYFGRRKRAHLPTLILALAFLVFMQRGMAAVIGVDGVLSAMITVGAMALFYWRIRLPFCIALIAVALLYLLFAVLGQIAPDLTRNHLGWVLLVCGLLIFGAALAYDTRDTHRRTRYADNAFWLHFLAAPLIIHSVALMSIRAKADVLFGFVPMVEIASGDAVFILIAIGFLTVIGLAINRRALIVSSLGYAIFALVYLFDKTGLGFGMSVIVALIALGAAIVFLGAGWHAARNILIKFLPKWKVFPPPYQEVEIPRTSPK